jgi:hypothetical protein
LVSADYRALLMLEGATGMRYDGVVYREVCDGDGPTRLNFMACWREANGNAIPISRSNLAGPAG